MASTSSVDAIPLADVMRHISQYYERHPTSDHTSNNTIPLSVLKEIITLHEAKKAAVVRATTPEDIIRDIAKRHYKGTMVGYVYPDDMAPVIKFAEANHSRLREILEDIGYTFKTCTSDDPCDEVVAVLKRTPYIDFRFGEASVKVTPEVSYYPKFSQSGDDFTARVWNRGDYSNVKVNLHTGCLTVDGVSYDSKGKIERNGQIIWRYHPI